MDVAQADLDTEFFSNATKPVEPDYNVIYTYNVTTEDIATANDFSEKLYPTVEAVWTSRQTNKLNPNKGINDSALGKLGEEAAYHMLTSLGFKCTNVDYKIYEKSKKSFDPDIFAIHPNKPGGRFYFHVKCQKTSKIVNTNNTPSWAFTRSDKMLYNPKEQDHLILCLYREKDRCVDIIDRLPCFKVFPRFLEELMTPSSKRIAIYYSDIQESIKEGSFY
jgi:hypothetical protein